MSGTGLDERFEGDDLDRSTWLPSYLPHWSSREAAAATHEVADGALRLWIPPEQPLWCEDVHEEPLRVSAVQSGSWSGPVGSREGLQPFVDGITVRSHEPTWWGCTPRYGRIEVDMRGEVTPRSMVACWLSGIEDVPAHSAEICIAELFGRDVHDDRVEIGMGVHAFQNPAVDEDFALVPVALDVAEPHTYACDWRADGIDLLVDGEVVAHTDQSPDHPVLLLLGVFDFPGWDPAGRWADHVPELVATRVAWTPHG